MNKTIKENCILYSWNELPGYFWKVSQNYPQGYASKMDGTPVDYNVQQRLHQLAFKDGVTNTKSSN